MSDAKISALGAIVTPLSTDQLAAVQGGATKLITSAQIVTGGGGTMAVQNASAITVTGGDIQGVNILPNLSGQWVMNEDFINGNTTSNQMGEYGWLTTVSGAGSQWTNTGDHGGGMFGVRRAIIGNAAGAIVAAQLQNTGWLAGGGAFDFSFRFRLPVLATAADDFVINFGFVDNATAAAPTDAIMFTIDKALNGAYGDIRGTCYSNGTPADTGVTDTNLAAATWYTGRIIGNAAGTSVSFYINGVLVGAPVTTQIPTGAGRTTGPGINVYRTAQTGNINAFDIDAIWGRQIFTAAR
jgi:hypothetical protein